VTRNLPYDIEDLQRKDRAHVLRPRASSCVFSPPFTIAEAQIGRMVESMRESVEAAIADPRAEGLWTG